MTDRQQFAVVKVGSSSLTDQEGAISAPRLERLAGEFLGLHELGVRPILVSSGAIAAGRSAAEHTPAPREDLTDLQAFAAIGQGILMATYAKAFAERDLQVAQVLLTAHDFGHRAAYLNTRATLERLGAWGVVPIVNENDATATQEITLGENDRLSALVATLVHARLLLILTDTKGVYVSDPRLNEAATLIQEVTHVDEELERVAGGAGTGLGSGGMATKLAAAKIASWSGIPCVIASADEHEVIMRAWRGEPVGTRIQPRSERLPARKVWIAFARQPMGNVVVDGGASRALVSAGGSLLSVGVRRVEGDFGVGDVVDILDQGHRLIAKGISRCAAADFSGVGSEFRGRVESDPGIVVHRDDLVVLMREV